MSKILLQQLSIFDKLQFSCIKQMKTINFKHLSHVEGKKLVYVCSCQNEWICAHYTDTCKSSITLHVGRNAFTVVLFFHQYEC
jgi:hypothetical protein